VKEKTPPTPWSVGIFLVAVIFAMCLTMVRDGDAWWQLKAGELISSTGIPRVDSFSYVISGVRWVDHEWLSQWVLYKAFAVGGAAGLIFLKAGVLACTFFLLWRSVPGRPLWAAFWVLLAAWGARRQFVIRPFIFDYLMIAGLGRLFWRLDFVKPPAFLTWALPLLTVVWVNLHGGAALLLPIMTAVAAVAERFRRRQVPWVFWSRATGLSLAALCLNPYGPGMLEHFWSTLQFSASPLLFEWRAPTTEFAGIYGLFLGGGAWAAWVHRKDKPFAAAWLLLMALASLRMQRNIALFLIVAAPAIVAAIPVRFAQPKAAWVLVFYVLATAGTYAHTYFYYPSLMRRYALKLDQPLKGAMAFLDRAGVQGRMFNEYEYGGELLFHGWPQRKVFIDSRAVEYGGELIQAALFWHRPQVWAALHRKFKFDYAVLRRHPSGAYTTRTLDASPEWHLVYFDDEAMVYLRESSGNRELIKRHGFMLLEPGRGNLQYIEEHLRAGREEAVLKEIDRALSMHPKLGMVLLLKPYVLMRAGRPREAEAAARLAVARIPERAQPRLTLAWLLDAAGDLAGAEATYKEALDLVRRRERATIGADILTNLGRLRERAGDPTGARAYYDKALRWSPQHGAARHNSKRLK
jgi:tetratricopeptide (TPR) repeat protein